MKTKAQKEREARHWQARSYKEAKDSVEGYERKGKKQEKSKSLVYHITPLSEEDLEKEQQKIYDDGEPLEKPDKARKVRVVSKKRLNVKNEKATNRKSGVEQDTQLKPTALEVINFKAGTQGYPENVEAFENMVAAQGPHSHEATDLLSRREWQARADEARIRLGDMRSDKWVLEMLTLLRLPRPTQIKRGKPDKKILGMEGGDFSQTTIDWFKDHPADLIYLSEHEEARTEAKRWQGFKGGIKSKGGGRPRKYHTPLEKKEAKKKSQQKRAKEARNKK